MNTQFNVKWPCVCVVGSEHKEMIAMLKFHQPFTGQ